MPVQQSVDSRNNTRLSQIYERLRIRLLDLTLRNPMLSFKHRASSKRHLRFVDAVPEEIYRRLVAEEGISLEVLSLRPPEDSPKDEREPAFVTEVEYAKTTDVEYLMALQALENTGHDDEIEIAKLERKLRDRVREKLGLPPRLDIETINPVDRAKELGINPQFELPAKSTKDIHSEARLQTLKWPETLDAAMEKIAYDARSAEQEMGFSTLFLAFGFLEWTDSAASSKTNFAPLLLLPVKIDEKRRTKGKKTFGLLWTGDGANTNLSLRAKLNEFHATLPEFQDDEEATGSFEKYFNDVQDAIKGIGIDGWRVHRWITLGHFNFGRFAMYDDLDSKKWSESPADHVLVGPVLSGTDVSDPGGNAYTPPDDYPIDDPIIERIAPILIHDADASQHSALIDVMKEKNLVVQGPPGTGKSQTITNIIANALAKNKTILFLSKKQAALGVVKRRLDAAGLGDFCLELHSDKSSPKHVIESLKKRTALGYVAGREPPPSDEKAAAQNRKDLNGYLEALKKSEADDESVYDLMWRALRAEVSLGEHFKSLKNIELPNALLGDPSALKSLTDPISIYAGIYADFSKRYCVPNASTWHSLEFGDGAHQGIVAGLLDDLEKFRESAVKLQALITQGGDLGVSTIPEVESIIALERALPSKAPQGAIVEMVSSIPAHVVETLIQLQLNFNAAKAQAQQLPDLSNANDSLLECIDRMGAAAAASGHDELLPSEAVTRAHKDIDDATALRSIIEGFTPAIEILGLSRSLQANAIEAIHVSVRSAQYMNGEILAWFQWMPAGGLETFKKAKEESTALQEAETKWRARQHSNKDKAWPSPDELRSVARLRRKSFLGKMLGLVSGDSKAIAALVQKMGGPIGAKPDPAKLEALAAHIQACTAFVHNENYRRVFGTAWRGFNTNFDQIGKILDFQQSIKTVLEALPFGPQIFEVLLKADEDTLKRLAADQRSTELYKKLPASLRQRLDGRSIDTISRDFASEINQARAVIASDPDGAVGLLNWPIRELREAIIAEKRRRQAQVALRAHSSAQMYGSLVRDEQAIENTRTALSWITTVKGVAGVPAPVAKGLLSGPCAVLRPRFAEFAESASAELDRCINRSIEIAARYDVCGFNLRDSANLATHLDDLLAHRDELGDFLALRNQKRLLENAGLGPFIREYEKRGLQLAELPIAIDGVAAFKRAAHKRSENHILRDANGIKLDQKRKLFAKQDKGKLDRDRATVRNILTAKQPPAGSRIGAKKTWTDMALLQNEFSKEKKFVPVRGLMMRASAAIQILKPCFMMSPLSLAKFLPAGKVRFDLIVIDEASQMLPEEALGALWRAKQFVVVGDQKQLPPTDFFARADGATLLTNDEEDMDGIDDADGESILEVCGNAFGQPRMLRWHYRSRCESLIAFSNTEFYHDELVTFPAARPGAFSVNLMKLRGNYKKGRNPAEAQIVAEEAIRFMRKHAALDVKDIPTIGIVAVNSQQRDLISEELRLLEADDPRVEEYRKKVEEKGDPVTVWNLENVQGDERDFIFVSLTYGPEPGMQKVHQRFGPINGKNGHRRLNVLFTRARSRLILFTSMSSSDVLCEPGKSAEGVRILKSYLEYAERGGKTGGTLTGKGADSDFEISVAERLRRRGYSVETQVGVSGYKIDLGIRHPDYPNRFIVGVECDGAAYHSSKSARDRDRLREEILRDLGWAIIRVWSTDWFDNPGVQTDRLVAAIEEYRRRPVLQDEEYRAETISEPQSILKSNVETGSEVHSGNIEADIESYSSNGASASSAAHAANRGRLTREEVFNQLRQFRENVIAKEMDGTWEPHRSVARDAMIEALIRQRLDDPLQWINKIPRFLRTGTNPVEKKRYLHQLCEIVNRLDT